MGMGSDPGAIHAALGVWDKDGCLERFYGIKLTRAHVWHDGGLTQTRRNSQQWNDSIKLQLGLYGAQEKILERYFHEDRLLRSAWSKRFEAPVRGLMWCPKLDQATPGDIGKQVDRDCNAFLNLQQAGEAPWRPLELCSEDVPLPPWQQSDMQAMERHRQVQQAARVGQWQQHLPHEKVHGIFVHGTRCPDHARIFISGPPGHVKHTLQALKDDVCLLPPGTDSQALPLRMFDRTLLTAPTWIQLGRLQACILFQAASPDSQVSPTPGHQAVDQHNQAWVCNRSLRPSVSLQGAAQRVSLEQHRQQQRRSLEQQLRVSLDLAASGASVTTSQVLMHELRQQQRRSLDAQREQQRRSIEQQRRSLEQRPQAPPWGRWLDRDTNPCLKFQRIGESMQRPLELCGWKDRKALPPMGKECYKLVNDRLRK
ncbi:hypothetical protein QJQ45_025761, partial [Haematococcus lacustris]